MKFILGVSAVLLFASIAPAGAVTYCNVTASVLRVHADHNVKSRILDRLDRGTTVRQTDTYRNWSRVHRVRKSHGLGWASSNYLRCRYAE